jgi:PASTA domain-containing protein
LTSESVHPTLRPNMNRLLGIVFVALTVGCSQTTSGEQVSPERASPSETISANDGGGNQEERVAVPRVVGKRLENAKDALRRDDLRVSVVRKYSSKPSATVLSQSISAGTEVRTHRTIRLVISKGPKPQPSPQPNCTSGYSPCLVYHGGADYDCYGGSGNGPYYTEPGVVYTVSGSDPYDLDADNNGSGCE